MIPRGKLQKNEIVERAIQNVKVDALRPFRNPTLEQARQGLFRHRNFYSFRRRHADTGNKRPTEPFKPHHHRYGKQFLRDVLINDFEVSNT
ncbi:MAG: hypothetical protein ACFFD4_04410 [Candidatus Odinarchaeota archaeon]